MNVCNSWDGSSPNHSICLGDISRCGNISVHPFQKVEVSGFVVKPYEWTGSRIYRDGTAEENVTCALVNFKALMSNFHVELTWSKSKRNCFGLQEVTWYCKGEIPREVRILCGFIIKEY